MKDKLIHKIIKEICEEEDIEFTILSKDYIVELKKNNVIKHVIGYGFDLNTQAASHIARDKYATYEILKNNNVPIIEHNIVFNPITRKEYISEEGNKKVITDYFIKNNNKLVIKPNEGSEGKGVSVSADLEKIFDIVDVLFKRNNTIILCLYYDIKVEYRTIYFNGECLLMYGKQQPYVIGDGLKTIEELVENGNFPNNLVMRENLSKLDLGYIPKQDEKIEISWKFNLSGGAKPEIITDINLKEKVFDIVKKGAEATSINYASIDVIETVTGEFYIMEINSTVGMPNFIQTVDNGYEIAKDIYKKAILCMF